MVSTEKYRSIYQKKFKEKGNKMFQTYSNNL